MSLDYDYRTITAEAREYFEAPENAGKLDACIWATMAVKIGTITEQNYTEFYLRYLMLNILIHQEPKPYLTLTDIHHAIGLKTNVFTERRSQFEKWLFDWGWEQYQARIRKEQEEL